MRFDSEIMNMTIDASRKAKRVGQAKIAAALVHRKSLVCICTNSSKTHPIQMSHGYDALANQLHAESHCLVHALRARMSSEELRNCVIYVARTKRIDQKLPDTNDNLETAMARPCKGCMHLIKKHGILGVHYTDENGGIESLEFRPR